MTPKKRTENATTHRNVYARYYLLLLSRYTTQLSDINTTPG